MFTSKLKARPLHSNNLLRQIPLGVTPPPDGLGWDYDTARSDVYETDYQTEAETIIEPVLRNQARVIITFFCYVLYIDAQE